MTDPRWQPPSPAELDELDAFLAGAPDAMPLPEAHGLLTAIVSAPTVIAPSTWQAMLLGDARFESQSHAQRIVGLIMRLYNQISSELDAGELITLPDVDNEQACSAWCRGYLAGTRLDDHWATDETAVMMLLPFGALSGEFDLTGEEDDAGNVIEDPTAHLAKFRTNLAAYVVALFDYWKPRRQRPAPPRSARKIGRNEPCPCGSGLKYKRCCGAAVH